MKILFAVDEAYPLYKIGGLGDVGGSLPKALWEQGQDVRIVLPAHPEVPQQNFSPYLDFSLEYEGKQLPVAIKQGMLPGSKVITYLVKEDTYISQQTDASDNHADKFAVFSYAIATWLQSHTQEWQPEVLHIHDWHTALIPVILHEKYDNHTYPCVATIHNLAYQGQTDTPVLEKIGISDQSVAFKKSYSPDHLLSILLEGLNASEAFNAVSPTYADEILTKEYGEGLHELLAAQKDKLSGILNGLDLETFNPAKDPHLFYNYDITQFEAGKKANRQALLKQLDLDTNMHRPLLGFVGRVDRRQKGIQLIIELFENGYFDQLGAQILFLGTGDPALEKSLHQAADKKDYARIFTRYDEALAVQIYAASDYMLIPSKYEPCGLVQMIAMRYGALPIARATGGLKDTIKDSQDGFLFDSYSSQAFAQAIDRALAYYSPPEKLRQLQKKAMFKDFSWYNSAVKYVKLYTKLTHRQNQEIGYNTDDQV